VDASEQIPVQNDQNAVQNDRIPVQRGLSVHTCVNKKGAPCCARPVRVGLISSQRSYP